MARVSSGVYVSWPKPEFKDVIRTHKHYKSNYNAALMYVHYEVSASDLKKEVIKYLRAIDPKHNMLDRIKDMHENRFTVIGKYIYLINRGCHLPESVESRLHSFIEKIIEEEEARLQRLATVVVVDEKQNFKHTVSIQERIKDKAKEIAGEIEGMIDDFCTNKKSQPRAIDEFVSLFKANDVKAIHAKHIKDWFTRRFNAISSVLENSEKDSGYDNFTKPELKKLHLLYSNILAACDMMQEVAKVERKPVKKKVVSLDKQVSKLKYKKDEATLGLVSISPTHIVGAKDLWTYNVKTRKLAHYKANDERGLQVTGASIENFSSKSMEKMLRKPADTLTEFKKASKIKLRTFVEELSTVDVTPKGRMCEFHILLRADK